MDSLSTTRSVSVCTGVLCSPRILTHDSLKLVRSARRQSIPLTIAEFIRRLHPSLHRVCVCRQRSVVARVVSSGLLSGLFGSSFGPQQQQQQQPIMQLKRWQRWMKRHAHSLLPISVAILAGLLYSYGIRSAPVPTQPTPPDSDSDSLAVAPPRAWARSDQSLLPSALRRSHPLGSAHPYQPWIPPQLNLTDAHAFTVEELDGLDDSTVVRLMRWVGKRRRRNVLGLYRGRTDDLVNIAIASRQINEVDDVYSTIDELRQAVDQRLSILNHFCDGFSIHLNILHSVGINLGTISALYPIPARTQFQQYKNQLINIMKRVGEGQVQMEEMKRKFSTRGTDWSEVDLSSAAASFHTLRVTVWQELKLACELVRPALLALLQVAKSFGIYQATLTGPNSPIPKSIIRAIQYSQLLPGCVVRLEMVD